MFFSAVLSDYIEKSSFIDSFNIAIIDNENSTKTELLIEQLADFNDEIMELFLDEKEIPYELLKKAARH